MPICRIFGQDNRLLRRFHTKRPEYGSSISVGISPHCAVSLSDDCPGVKGVAEVHFSLVKREDGWHLSSPGPELQLSNGRSAQNALLTPGLEVEFGNCRIQVIEDPEPSEYCLLYQMDTDTKYEPLGKGDNFIGSDIDCEVCLKDSSLARQHALIRIEDWQITLAPLDNANINLNGKTIRKESELSPGDRLRIGEMKLKFVRRDSIPSNTTLPGQQNPAAWRIVNTVLLLLLVGLVWMVFHRRQLESHRNSAKATAGQPDKKADPMTVIGKHLKAGKPQQAIMILQQESAGDKRDKLLADAEIEADAVAALLYYTEQAKVLAKTRQTSGYLRYLLTATGSGKQLAPQISYWRVADERITDFTDKLRKADPEIRDNSWFMTNAPKLRSSIQAMKDLVENYQRLQLAWKNEQWEIAVQIFDRLYDKHEQDNVGIRTFYETAQKRARFVRSLHALWKEFSEGDFRTIDIGELMPRLEKLETKIPELELPPEEKSHALNYLATLKNAFEDCSAIRKAYDAWRKNPDTPGQVSKLSIALKNTRDEQQSFAIIDHSDKVIQSEIGKWLQASVEKLPADPLADNLARCDELMDVCLVTRFESQELIYRKLNDKKQQIQKAIQVECDRLFYEYREQKHNASPLASKKILDDILATAPVNSRYAEWAKKEIITVDAGKTIQAELPIKSD